ncbi:MAG: aminotransferase class I/II-fold pyridoxal phosphate-dependent enzyme [Pseudomonadota bacterium]
MTSARSPFERLHTLLDGIDPGGPPVDLTVGGPRQPIPPFVADVIAENAHLFGKYPPIGGTKDFRDTVHAWIDKRYSLSGALTAHGGLLPLNGSREGLFFAAIVARDVLQKENPAILLANPFYQTYLAAAHTVDAEPIALGAAPGVLQNFDALDPTVLDRTIGIYIASPANPEGDCASAADWEHLFEAALRHNFFIFADECYSEIYREGGPAPIGALEAAAARPEVMARLMVFNSLSKRSNLAGMRVGFVAGGHAPIEAMRAFRNQAAPQVPIPLQAAAAATFRDEAHVIANRRLYDEKFEDVDHILGPLFGAVVPPAGFFLWLPVRGNDVAITRSLWAEAGVKAVPGRYLAAPAFDGTNPGEGYVRFALVGSRDETKDALKRMRGFFAAHADLAGERQAATA